MFLPKGIIVCMGPLSFGKLKLFFVLHCAWSENYCFYSTFQIKNNEEKKRGTASARSNNCSCAKEISWKKDIQLANLPQPFAKSFFFFFLLNNDIIIQQAKQRLSALQASAIVTRRLYILNQKALKNLIAYFAASWAAALQYLLTQLKLYFKKNLRRSSILLIIVAMDQSGCNSNVVRGSKQDLASPFMMICCHFSLCASWIAQHTAAASACIGEVHSCLLAQTLNTSPFLFLAPF